MECTKKDIFLWTFWSYFGLILKFAIVSLKFASYFKKKGSLNVPNLTKVNSAQTRSNSRSGLTILCIRTPGRGHSTFFQVGVCGPDFQSVGLVNWHLSLKRGACEQKISKFGGLWAKIRVKIEAVQAKISKISQKGVLWTDSFAWNGTLASGRRGVKGGSSGLHIPIPPF